MGPPARSGLNLQSLEFFQTPIQFANKIPVQDGWSGPSGCQSMAYGISNPLTLRKPDGLGAISLKSHS